MRQTLVDQRKRHLGYLLISTTQLTLPKLIIPDEGVFVRQGVEITWFSLHLTNPTTALARETCDIMTVKSSLQLLWTATLPVIITRRSPIGEVVQNGTILILQRLSYIMLGSTCLFQKRLCTPMHLLICAIWTLHNTKIAFYVMLRRRQVHFSGSRSKNV